MVVAIVVAVAAPLDEEGVTIAVMEPVTEMVVVTLPLVRTELVVKREVVAMGDTLVVVPVVKVEVTVVTFEDPETVDELEPAVIPDAEGVAGDPAPVRVKVPTEAELGIQAP